jgi:transcription elongation factor Elf1
VLRRPIETTRITGHPKYKYLTCPVCVNQALAESRFRCPAVSIAVPSSSVEHEFTCPYCGEEISMVLDLSVGRQTYIEDCEACCRPIEVSFTVEDDELASFYAKTLE